MNNNVAALRFFFTHTLDRPDLAAARADEADRQATSRAESRRSRQAALSISYGAGLRMGEVVMLKLRDIDSERMLLRVERGKGASTATLCFRKTCSHCCSNGRQP